MRRAALALVCALVVLTACGEDPAIPDVDLRLRITSGADEVAPGQGFPVTVVRIWRKDLEPSAWEDRALAPLVVREEGTTRREDEERIEETRRYRAYAFSLKDVTIPAVPLSASGRPGAGGVPRVTRSEPVRVRVRPALDPKNPGPPEGPGAQPEEESPWFLRLLALAAAVLAAAVVGIQEARRRPSGAAPGTLPDAPATPAGRALAALAALREHPAEEPASRRADVIELSDIVRDYVAAVYGVRARRRTTPEVLDAIAARDGLRAALGDLLVPCDLTKFAAHTPDGTDRLALIERAERFVRARTAGAAS